MSTIKLLIQHQPYSPDKRWRPGPAPIGGKNKDIVCFKAVILHSPRVQAAAQGNHKERTILAWKK